MQRAKLERENLIFATKRKRLHLTAFTNILFLFSVVFFLSDVFMFLCFVPPAVRTVQSEKRHRSHLTPHPHGAGS